MTHKQMSAKGGRAGKGSPAKAESAKKANAARWEKHRKAKCVAANTKRRRMTHTEAVRGETKRWRFTADEEALILAFCACVGIKMKGSDMDDILSPPSVTPKGYGPNE